MSRDLQLGILALILAAGYYAAAAALPESLLADAVGPQGLPKIYAAVLAALALALIVRTLSAASRSAVSTPAAPPFAAASAAAPIASVPVAVAPNAAPTRSGEAATGVRASHAAGRALGMLLIGIGYVAVVPHIGYIPALAGLITCTAAYQARGFTKRIVAVGLAGAVLLWVLFVLLLGIPQPQGPWPPLF